MEASIEKDEEKSTAFRWWESRLVELAVFASAFILILLSYILIKPLNGMWSTQNGEIAKMYGAFLLVVLIVYMAVEIHLKKMTYEKELAFIIGLAFIIHLTYMLYTPYDCRQHDMSYGNEDGHYAYAITFFETWKLPTEHITADTIYQFYHPPLNAFIQAVFMNVFKALNWNASLEESETALFSSCQILSCLYTFIMSYYGMKIMLLLPLSKESSLFGVGFVALFPRLIQLSGQLNNDSLSIMFSFIAVYYFLRWHLGKRKMSDLLLTSLFIGLSMFAKMSGVIICLGLGFIMIWELVSTLKKKEGALPLKSLIIQYVLFIAICAPLGLWWQLYTHKVYGLPFNFVFKNLTPALFTGVRSWAANNMSDYWLSLCDTMNQGEIYTNAAYNTLVRFILPFYAPDYSASFIFCNAAANYNLLTYAIKCSIFGEFSYWYGEGFGIGAVFTGYIIWFALLFLIVYCLVKKIKFGKEGIFFLALGIGIIIFYLYLQISMPFGCSMDFRYIVPIILPIGYFMAKGNDIFSSQNTNFGTFMSGLFKISVFVFIFCSYAFYLLAI
jgi:hypothetical protein